MAYDQQTGTSGLRQEVVSKVIKGFAEASYKFKQALAISPTSAWKDTYYRETATALGSPTANSIKAIPRGANFPQAVVTWEKVSAYQEKYGLEDNIYWEDILTNAIDVQARTMFRIAEGVTKAVDDQIWTIIAEAPPSATTSNIQQISIGATKHWSGASAAIIDNLAQAIQKIAEYNYDTSNLMCFISPKDARSIKRWITDKGTQFTSFSEDIARNGKIGTLMGITLIQSNSVTASYALVVVPKICATWSETVPLTTTTVTDPYKSVKIRSVEMGVTLLTDPKAIVRIDNTQGTSSTAE